MQKPQYELVPLRTAVMQCRTNIVTFQDAITKEENKIDELLGYISKWNEYNEWLENGNTSESIGKS